MGVLSSLNQHELFINALVCSKFDEATLASKIQAYLQRLNSYEQTDLRYILEQLALQAERFNNQDVLRVLTQLKRCL